MLKLLALLSLSVVLEAQTNNAPAPLSAADQITIAREQTAELQAELDLARAQLAAVAARARYAAAVDTQRAAHNAAGCDLTTAQTWTCPPKPPAK
jgi:hypothetical protein